MMHSSLAQVLSEKVKRKAFDLEDYLFEKLNSLELGGIISSENLVTESGASQLHANAYHAVWCRNLRELFSEALKTGMRFENFIDVGSGKGKACFYARNKFDFANIIGVEFSQPLIEIANKNKTRARAGDIHFLHADAAEFIFPDQTNLVFMFNPFNNVVLEKMIANNLAHFRERKSVIAYANDVERISLLKFGFETIFRNQTRRISLYRLP